ncbi:SusD/RagB family nutrient-binding outer membrane lipoprotein [Mucilaginibacter celer]|uniref:SusD/RagB family nutrient-binding outer membrane lipoprotein n=1 Tax=Mucilaginibacter celer TaxID=2305508 RepID=A0A494VLM3_9SPHI|nr:SusD/RagB family nutrient-binding outer membrane lipoprotein [Mucilaginibacter celer]AYL96157.1 SusD/RagB family nutrient-binding outer membrane lipoprotein [Mucilaginibacter celer]
MKKFKYSILILALLAVSITGCQKMDGLQANPNVNSATSLLPPSLFFNHAAYSLYQGGGVIDGRPGSVFEGPWDQVMRWNQYTVSNFAYYRGQNAYIWSNSATAYDLIRYANFMEQKALALNGTNNNIYGALGKFLRAYSFVWLTQRVGDIPASDVGNTTTLTPKYDSQHDVYKRVLAMLDTANTIAATAIKPNTSTNNSSLLVDGDIYGLTYAQWQKVINTYKLRVLISLSKRADDNADLSIKQQFAAIVSNPNTYPIMTANADNLAFKYVSLNPYPHSPTDGYNIYESIGQVYLKITTDNKDPRTFVVATPSPAQLVAPNNKSIGDFSAYVGADINLTQTQLNTAVTAGVPTGALSPYSFVSFKRYYSSLTGPEPYIILGYSEMCFNIAEAANRGWLPGVSAATWYGNGIDASLAFYGISNGQSLTIGDIKGNTLGTVTADVAAFKTAAAYTGDNAAGLTQILNQKYVSMFQNSGWEAYYNWRRTGIPALVQGGPGIGTSNNLIPRRWQYPTDEKVYNTANVNAAIQSQYGGTDDLYKDMWLTK